MKEETKLNVWGLPGIFALTVLLLDQASKWATILVCPEPGSKSFEILPGYLTLVHWRNLGAAWGMGSGHTSILAGISLLSAVLLIVFFRKITENRIPAAYACGILLGGVVGNFIDRAFYPDGVVDFIFVHWRDRWGYPAFNVADSAICCSIAFLVIYTIWSGLPWNSKKTTER